MAAMFIIFGALLLGLGGYGIYTAYIYKRRPDENNLYSDKLDFPDTALKTFYTIPTGDTSDYNIATTHGSARWLADNEKEKLTNPTRSALWLGGGYFDDRQGHLITIAKPRSGKGAGVLIPNLLLDRKKDDPDFKFSFVINDPKGTNGVITAKAQREQGQKVIFFDPFDIQGANGATHGIKASSLNPLDYIEFLGEDVLEGCKLIAELMLPSPPDPKDKMWVSQGRDLLKVILMHVCTSFTYEGRRNLEEVYRIVRKGKWAELFFDMKENDACNGEIANSAEKWEFSMGHEGTFMSTVFSLGDAMDWLDSAPIKRSFASSNDFNPADLDKGGYTVYVCFPPDLPEQYSAWPRLILGILFRLNYKAKAYQRAKVFYIFDEFPTMGKFDDIVKTLAYSAELNMRIWIFSQTISHISDIYGENLTNSILGTCGIFQAFMIGDSKTAEYLTKRLGSATISYNQTSTSDSYSYNVTKGGGSSDGKYSSNWGESASYSKSTSTSENFKDRPLLTYDEVFREPNIITFVENLPPMRLYLWHYYRPVPTNISVDWYRLLYPKADENPNFKQK